MNIRGLIKFSLNDFPGKIACVVFVGGCNLRCGYCHNPHLVFDPESQPLIEEDELLDFLSARAGKLDGVVITGGEPTMRKQLPEFAKRIKALGFLVKLDTNGVNPGMVFKFREQGLVDFLGLDYKATAARYPLVTNSNIPDLHDRVVAIMKRAVNEELPMDVRTTVHKSLLNRDHLGEMRRTLDDVGVQSWTLQQFNPVDVIDDDLIHEPTFSDGELRDFAKSLGNGTRVRNLKGVFVD